MTTAQQPSNIPDFTQAQPSQQAQAPQQNEPAVSVEPAQQQQTPQPQQQARQTPAPAQSQPGPRASGVEDFDDLPPALAPTDGTDQNAEREDTEFRSFENILGAPAQQPQEPVPQSPPGQSTQPQQPAQQPQAQPQGQPPAQPGQQQVAQPTVPQQQAPQAPAQPQQAAPGQPQQQPGQQPQQPPAARPEKVFDDLRAGIEQNKAVVVEALQKHYESTISDDDVELLNTDPKKALSGFAAKLHTDSLQNTIAVIAQNLPGMVNGLMQAQLLQKQAEDTFYEKFPQLDRTKHGDVIGNMAKAYRQANPQVDSETFIQHVGAMAMMQLGLQPQPQQPQQPQPQQAPQQPAMRMPRGFVPAGNGQMPEPPRSPQQNPFSNMADFIMAEDRGVFDGQ